MKIDERRAEASAQEETVHCKDCIYGGTLNSGRIIGGVKVKICCVCCNSEIAGEKNAIFVHPDASCSHAERGTK